MTDTDYEARIAELEGELAICKAKAETEMGIADRAHERANRAEREVFRLKSQALDVSIAIAQRDKAWLERDELKVELSSEKARREGLELVLFNIARAVGDDRHIGDGTKLGDQIEVYLMDARQFSSAPTVPEIAEAKPPANQETTK
jgi:hypothetical protein